MGKWESRGGLRDFQEEWESRFLTFPLRGFSTAFRAAIFSCLATRTFHWRSPLDVSWISSTGPGLLRPKRSILGGRPIERCARGTHRLQQRGLTITQMFVVLPVQIRRQLKNDIEVAETVDLGVLAARRCIGRVSSQAQAVWRRYGRPAVKAAKIQNRVGFHTFRHTYTTLLTQNNEEVKVVTGALRRANSRITLDLYAQADMPNKRLVQSKLVRMVLNKGEALA